MSVKSYRPASIFSLTATCWVVSVLRSKLMHQLWRRHSPERKQSLIIIIETFVGLRLTDSLYLSNSRPLPCECNVVFLISAETKKIIEATWFENSMNADRGKSRSEVSGRQKLRQGKMQQSWSPVAKLTAPYWVLRDARDANQTMNLRWTDDIYFTTAHVCPLRQQCDFR